MAKRGGVVFSHVRFGEQVWSPTIAKGEADALIALEWAEGLRWLDYLRPSTGVFIADTRRIVPPFACRNRKRGAATRLRARKRRPKSPTRSPRATRSTRRPSPRSSASPARPTPCCSASCRRRWTIPVEDWLSTLDSLTPSKIARDQPQGVRGRPRLGGSGARRPVPAVRRGCRRHAAPSPQPDVVVKLEINAAWCKGCDICVKLCPERCLALNAEQVAVLKNPEACTGCHVCEWLCPDFAISVRTKLREPVVA